MAENTNTSTKYQDIILKSVLIRSSPSVYRLNPKRNNNNLTKMTVGEKNLNKTNKTILLVGETGTGKSTLVNALLNYSVGVKFEDNIWFDMVEEDKRDVVESQTSDVIVYEIFDFKDQTLPYSLTIIDTPGYGDTKGKENDLVVRQRLLDLFSSEDGVHELHAVGLVMKATDNRLSDRLRYVFNSVTSLFGKDLEKNIVVLIAHSDGRKPRNVLNAFKDLKIKCALNEKNEPVHFLFNNCQSEDRTEDREILEQADKVAQRGLDQFKEFLDKTTPQKIKITVDVLNERITLEACVHNLKDRITETELKQREVEQIQEALNHEEEMKKNENFIIVVDEVYKEKEPIAKVKRLFPFYYKRAVCCTVCKQNCHYPGCTLAKTPEDCKVMKRGCCTVCSNKCPASAHVKDKCIFVTRTRKVQKTHRDVKKKYELIKAEKEGKLNLLKKLEEEMNKLTTEKKRLVEESYQHIVKLEQIALNIDSLSIHVHLDFLIEKMKETKDTEKVKKLEEMSRVDEGTRAALRYMSGKTTADKE